jgi:hypothetical protein
MEIEKNIFTFIIYTIIVSVIGAIAVIAVNQAIKNNSTVSDLQTNITSLETSFNVLQQKNDNDLKNVLRTGDEVAIVFPDPIKGTDQKTKEWRLGSPDNCSGDGNDCAINFSGGITAGVDGGWKLFKKNK